MTTNASVSPPRWADRLLRASLSARDVDCVSGDFLEEYRSRLSCGRGQWRADAWFVQHAVGVATASVFPYAVLFALVFLARTAMDWRVPPADFHNRALITTGASVIILLVAGVVAGARAESAWSAVTAAVVTTIVALPIQVGGSLLLLVAWHDPATWTAIQGSGGIDETLTLPFAMPIAGVFLGGAGGVLGVLVRTMRQW